MNKIWNKCRSDLSGRDDQQVISKYRSEDVLFHYNADANCCLRIQKLFHPEPIKSFQSFSKQQQLR